MVGAAEWSELYSQIEAMVVDGHHDDCRRLFERMNRRRVPREWASRLAELAWRINEPLWSLQLLKRFVYPENRFAVPATPHEKVIYATALSSLGATDEAARILGQIDGETEPEALFHRASGMMYAWNYAAAIPLLRSFLRTPRLATYRILVGRVNLAAALIDQEEWDSAERELELAIANCEKGGYRLLHGNCLELKGQIAIFQRRFGDAEKLLKMAIEKLSEQKGLYSLYAEKWLTISRALCAKAGEEQEAALGELRKTQEKATALHHWNTVRECDLFRAIVTNDSALFKKVVVGSPAAAYRTRARRLFKAETLPIGRYELELGCGSGVDVFDPSHKLHKQPMLFQLFEALMSDFYQPQTVGQLFQQIYPNEKFNAFSSPDRVLRLLRRLNDWFIAEGTSLRVILKKSEFRIDSERLTRVVLWRGAKRSSETSRLAEIRKVFADRRFTITDLTQAMHISKPTAERWLRKMFIEGRVQKERARRGVVYRMTPRSAINTGKARAA